MAKREKLFGTNGVRFIPGVTHTLEFVIELAEAIGTYFDKGTILVGHDGRVSSPAIYNALIAGLMSSGCDVLEAGLVPTPALQYSVRHLGVRGGVMVTASHNPPQYNGLKVIAKDGIEIDRVDEEKIEGIFYEQKQYKADWKEVGESRKETSVIENYLNGVLAKVNTEVIRRSEFKIVLDLGNGAQCVAAPYLIEELGCELITINSVVDGNFPGRGPEPVPEKLETLSLAVKSSGADLGVAYDGDGDRAIFCDEKGNILWGDESGCLISDFLLEKSPDGTIVTPVSSTQAIEIIAKRRGGNVIRTRVGSVDVSRKIMESNALFGFEENGGCIYPKHIAVRDGCIATALMLECLATRSTTLSRAISNYVPKFYRAKGKVEVKRDEVRKILDKIEEQAKGKIEKIDGLKIWLDEKKWVLIRPSGTEPIIRVFAEAMTKKEADRILSRYLSMIGRMT